MILTAVGTTCKWSNTGFVLFHLAHAFPCCEICLFPFYVWIILHFMYKPHFVCPTHLSLHILITFRACENCCCEHCPSSSAFCILGVSQEIWLLNHKLTLAFIFDKLGCSFPHLLHCSAKSSAHLQTVSADHHLLFVVYLLLLFCYVVGCLFYLFRFLEQWFFV